MTNISFDQKARRERETAAVAAVKPSMASYAPANAIANTVGPDSAAL